MKKALILMLLVVFFAGVILSTRIYLDDDAIISYRYVHNLVKGRGLIPFENGPRLEGYSNPSLVFATATIATITNLKNLNHILFIGLWLNTLGALGTLFILFRWGKNGYLPAIAMAGCYHWQCIRGSGLETALYTFLLTLSIFCFSKKRYKMGLAMALLIALSRPEGIGLAILISLTYLYETRNEIFTSAKRVFTVVILPFAAFLLWRFWYFGEWLSNTSFAKTHLVDRGVFSGSGLLYIFNGMAIYPILLVLFGLTLWRFHRDLPKYEIAVLFGQLAFISVIGADEAHFGPFRFLIPILPILFRSLTMLTPEKLPTNQRRKIAIAVVTFAIFCPTYSKHNATWDPNWFNQIHGSIKGELPKKLYYLAKPRPWLDEHFSQFLAENVSNPESKTLASIQGGALLIHWKGNFKDIAGLLSADYAKANSKQREELFRTSPPDIYANFEHVGITLKYGWVQERHFFPSVQTLKELGYKPVLIYKINGPDLWWGGKLWKNHSYFNFIAYTRDPSILRVDHQLEKTHFTHQDETGKIETEVPILMVNA